MSATVQDLKPLHLQPVRREDPYALPLQDGKIHLLLCATGSVATIKIPNIIQSLAKYSNLSVRLIFTKSSANFLSGQSVEQPSIAEVETLPNVDGVYFDEDEWREPWTRGNKILHIELRRWADIMVIAPLSANALAKITQGWSDNLLLSVVRAWDTTGELDPVRDLGDKSEEGIGKKRIVVAPSMNTAMWKQPITEKQIKVLEEEWGVQDGGWFEVLRPMEKELACGDVGGGAMKDWKKIVEVIENRLGLAQHEIKTNNPQTTQRHTNEPSGIPPPSPRTRLTISSFELGRPLGRGKFGKVYLARHLESNYICAIKTLSKAQCASRGGENLVRRELEVHQNLAHPHILRFHTWLDDAANIYLVLEYAPNGNLYRRLRKQPRGRFSEREVAVYISQMAQALRYLHSKNIMHRDIKPENILLGLHNEIKLADFGYSVHSSSGMRSTVCGTLDYLSPEVVLMMLRPGKAKQWYTKAIDQWGLGVLTYELLVGWPPFETKTEMATQKKIANFTGKVKFPSHVSKPAEEFVLQLLDIDAEKRMGLEDALVHPWIKGHLEEHSRTVLRLRPSGNVLV
ncbi:kinase-like protein [Periconia macrospinosa]|uniref:Aurora kinase n=1 Tax=Periconia macrospinosa TaxID=97972 RepID=A0A2V1EBQ7_9PLEO|nr:kinase-like protein [Periconia macrospinosa]